MANTPDAVLRVSVDGGGPESVRFRDFMSSWFTGVAVVTSTDATGRPHGLTCNSLTSVTADPPTLLVCLGDRSGTLAAIRARHGFVVNLLCQQATAAAEAFASRRPDRFEQVDWRPSGRLGLPVLGADAYAVAECEVAGLNVVGDHVVVLGRVLDVTCGPGDPLLYGRRTFRSVR